MVKCRDILQMKLDGMWLLAGEGGLDRVVSWTYVVMTRPFADHNDGSGNRLLGMYFLDYVHEGLIKLEDIWSMPDVIAGKYKRTADTQSFACACYGMPVWDVAWGAAVLSNAKKNDIGTVLKLWDTPDMY